MANRTSWLIGGLLTLAVAVVTAVLLGVGGVATVASASPGVGRDAVHVGVASCSGSTCHGRQEADGKIVRQDELMRWQEPSSPTGAHSRAFAILAEPRSQVIAQRLGLGSATSAPMCLGCHGDPAYAGKGPRFQQTDGVGCEACHGGAGGDNGWLSSHYAANSNHADSVARGLVPLDDPRVRAETCLDCHFGSDQPGQFVSHRIMAAGHPRVSFELDLFTTLQAHHDEDADYVARKGRSNHVKTWAIGQAVALDRALSLYANAKLAQDGIFPEFYFFDCHSCHRRIYDEADARPSAIANPGRPIPSGMAPFNDENMIMLMAAARATAPGMASQLEADSRAFHAALASDRASAVRAAGRLRGTANRLAATFGGLEFSRAQMFAIVDQVAGGGVIARYTDYEGSVQAVMAADTLLNALVSAGHVGAGSAATIRSDINLAYRAVRDPNDYRPLEFRAALARAAGAIRALR